MKKIIIIAILISTISIGRVLASDTIKANNPLIEYTGRIDFSNPLAPTFSYSGVSIRANFQGTSIGLIMNDKGLSDDADTSNYYNIIIDNIIVKRIQVSNGLKTYQLASNLSDTIHEIEIFRLTELTFGKTIFIGFLIDKGKNLVAISNQRLHLIEFVGNSITCGYGNEGLNGGKFGAFTENHYLTYAAFTSRNFNARHLAVCRSGIGIYRNYGEATTGSTDCMTNNYGRIFLYDKKPLYNFQLKPDLICVDLGTNDFSDSQNGFLGDSARYVSKYFSFIDTLQNRNKGSDIFVLLGSMMGDPDLSKVRRYLIFLVDSANKKDKGKLYFFEMSQQKGDLGIGIDYHPTVAQHLKNSLELTKYISQIKGWKVNPAVLKAEVTKSNEVKVYCNTNIVDTLRSYEGFNLIAGTESFAFEKVYVDAVDHSILHIVLDGNIAVNETVTLSYIPGTVISSDNIKLGTISNFSVYNNLSETKVTKANVDKTGINIYINLNKPIVKPENLNGIRFYDSENNTLQIDTFKFLTTTIQFVLKSAVAKDETIYLTLPNVLYGLDGVPVNALSEYQVLNNSEVITKVKKKELEGTEITPNPFTNEIKIKTDGKFQYTIYSLEGKLMDEGSARNKVYTGNKLKAGTYIVKINKDKSSFSVKIIKK